MKETEIVVPIKPVKKHLEYNFGLGVKLGVDLETADGVLVIDALGNTLVIDRAVIAPKRQLYLSLHAASHILLGHHLILPYDDIVLPRRDNEDLLSPEEKIRHSTAKYLTMGILNKRIGRYWEEIWRAIDLKGASEEMEDDIKADAQSLVKLLGDYHYHHDI